jgi:hypothetical protein
MDTAMRAGVDAFQLRLLHDPSSPYGCVDGQSCVDVPSEAIRGRSGVGKTFRGYLDLEKKVMRIDCAEDLAFWIEIHFLKIPAFFLQPDAPGGKEAVASAAASSLSEA